MTNIHSTPCDSGLIVADIAMSASLPLHPLCTLFPRMEGCALQELAGDIKLYGLHNPIVLHDGMILDGGNRYAACLHAGVEPKFIEYDGDNIVAFVLSMNMHRRHMSVGQFAVITSLAQDWGKSHPAHRAKEVGNVADLSTVADRASMSGASVRTQGSADKVAKADPELAKQVARGSISLPAAVKKVEKKSPKPRKEKPAPEPKVETPAPTVNAELLDANAEQGQPIRQLLAKNIALTTSFETDDKLASLVEENTKLHELNRVLGERNHELQNEIVALKKATQSWQRRAEKAERICEPS
jgi:ParB-like chromosome segregation protein Spo0J